MMKCFTGHELSTSNTFGEKIEMLNCNYMCYSGEAL